MVYNALYLLASTSWRHSLKIKRAKSTSTEGHYVRNADLLPAVIEAKKLGKVTEKLIKMIWMIAERYSHKGNFIGYSYREDMVASAVTNLCNNALKFDPEKSSNPFAYYTTGIYHSFLQYMAEEKNHRKIRDTLLVESGFNPSYGFENAGKQAEDSTINMSDDTVISGENHLETEGSVLTMPETHAGAPVAPVRNPSYGQQQFSMMDPGKPGDKRLSRFKDMNPGPVKVYKPSEYEYDPITKQLTIKPKPPEEPKVEAPPKKKAKKVVKKPLKKVAKKKAKKQAKRK